MNIKDYLHKVSTVEYEFCDFELNAEIEGLNLLMLIYILVHDPQMALATAFLAGFQFRDSLQNEEIPIAELERMAKL